MRLRNDTALSRARNDNDTVSSRASSDRARKDRSLSVDDAARSRARDTTRTRARGFGALMAATRSTLALRVLLVAGSTAVALAIAWLCVSRRKHESVRLADNTSVIESVLTERARSGPIEQTSGGLVREPVPRAQALALWLADDRWEEYDPHCYYRLKGGLNYETPNPEHPRGRVLTHTSSDGYLEDFDHLREKRDLFVLATGDSNMGVCDNDESFPNLVERALVRERPGKEIEVLNAGVSGFCPYNYLGVLERDKHLAPDAFVVAVYGGNDFINCIKPWHYFHHTVPPTRTKEFWQRLNVVQRNQTEAGMAFLQLLYFKLYPEQLEISVRACEDVSQEIEKQCAEQHIALYWIFIPIGFRTAGELAPTVATIKRELELSDDDMKQFDELADRFIGSRRARGQTVVDMREHFKDPIETYYWKDLHINLKGHELIAELLLPLLEAKFPPKN